ncbi:alkaline ceramidase 3 isoform X1 [Metopolophium dirhodum]|uniref:alkaline ceramidase 3 isoform X1 n=1 Tax=Metopolophium dirhodum TaxID=44670 RepID=UPI00298F5488|nr:alkaline ceramidase 3 isoform X1 [Metopolophium dirhodum]XP_060863438.1 alkaline ceramidase 3 isoform X1 [Metopolophium dirhodum]
MAFQEFNDTGYWGKPTATIDWCEKNYEVNYYVAEMWNTISNLMMIIPPLWGIWDMKKQKFAQRFFFCYSFILVVGFGSLAFHMTLLYEMQLFDELPMVWGTCYCVYCLSIVKHDMRSKIIPNKLLLLTLIIISIGFAIIYLAWPQPLLQHFCYGILVAISLAQEIKLILEFKCAVCKRMFMVAIALYLFGFFLWNIDNILCKNITILREQIPIFIQPFTQMHAWWHIFAGYGVYIQVLFCIHSTYDYHKKYKHSSVLLPEHMYFSIRWQKTTKRGDCCSSAVNDLGQSTFHLSSALL